MTTPHNPSTTASPTARRRPRRRPGPFPVTITQPATTTTKTAELTPVQRNRRHAADQGAAELTAAARQGRRPYVDSSFAVSISEAPQIIATAAGLAANPAPGALRIGRDLRGRPVAVVLHAATWSLLVRPAPAGYAPTSWAFVDGRLDDLFGGCLPCLGFTLDDDPSIASVEWTDMLAEVLTLIT
jgi:hypothetical protein